MTCSEVTQRIELYLLGEMDQGEITLVSQHLDKCPRCRNQAVEKRGKALLSTLDNYYQKIRPTASEELSSRILQSIDNEARYRERSSRSKVVKLWLTALAGVAAAVLLTVGLYLLVGQSESKPFEVELSNGSFIKAPAGSVVSQLETNKFRLEKGKMQVYLKSDKKQPAVDKTFIQTPSCDIKILEFDPNNSVDFEVDLDGEKTTIQIFSGVLEVTGKQGKVIAQRNQAVTVSSDGTPSVYVRDDPRLTSAERKARIEKALKMLEGRNKSVLDKTESRVVIAVSDLIKLGAKEHAKEIAELLRSHVPIWKEAALIALAELGAREYAKEIALLLTDNEGIARSAIIALTKLGASEYLSKIAVFLKSNDMSRRAQAVWAVGIFGGKEYIKEILDCLQISGNDQETKRVKRAASLSLGMLGAKEAAGQIALLLKDESAFVRGSAVLALGLLDAKEYAKEIAQLINDASSYSVPEGLKNKKYKSTDSVGSVARQVLKEMGVNLH